jgi:excisionase family DNA binding protein
MTGYLERDGDIEFGQVLDHFLDRLAIELADRVERRLEQIASQRASDGPQALDVKQAAARLGVSPTTMHELVISGEIPSVKVGRRRLIAASTITRLLAQPTDSAPTPLRRRAPK